MMALSLTRELEFGTCGRVACGRAAILLMTFLKELEDLPRRHKGTKDF